MNSNECMGRLTNSATHDLRNVLAVIRESVGLVQDILHGADPALPRLGRVQEALGTVQDQVSHGAALTEGMGYLGQCGEYADEARHEPCDLSRITRDFCTMASRRGNACSLKLLSHSTAEPVLSPAAPLDVFRALLEIFDACMAVGGGVSLRFKPLRRARATGTAGILCEVLEGGKNTDMVVSALTGHPLLCPDSVGWPQKLVPGLSSGGPRFILLLENAEKGLQH